MGGLEDTLDDLEEGADEEGGNNNHKNHHHPLLVQRNFFLVFIEIPLMHGLFRNVLFSLQIFGFFFTSISSWIPLWSQIDTINFNCFIFFTVCFGPDSGISSYMSVSS